MPACKPCNDRLGHEVEGKLLSRNDVLNLARVEHGSALPVAGVMGPGAHRARFDLATGDLTYERPISSWSTTDSRSWTLHASPQQATRLLPDLRRILSAAGRDPEDAPAVLAAAERTSLAGERFTFELSTDLHLHARLGAKVALACGFADMGEDFNDQPLAHHLRRALWDGELPSESMSVEALTVWDQYLAQLFAGAGDPPPQLAPGDRGSQTVFVPMRGRTAVFVHVAGWPLGLAGAVYDVAAPHEWEHLPVVVQDGRPRPTIQRVSGAALAWAKEWSAPVTDP